MKIDEEDTLIVEDTLTKQALEKLRELLGDDFIILMKLAEGSDFDQRLKEFIAWLTLQTKLQETARVGRPEIDTKAYGWETRPPETEKWESNWKAHSF